ncbi:lysine-specific demethylase JMJ30 isoform X1 [Ricinus communis]|uniref:lysine-specific demethylase JMJ30 isoform X1 n=1 Tax=Ricinus communis TaxID=3988 RepID=UPI000772CF62|nr:lysine-specific demethylase JMJ30 isoform X1 [Ricinus communis]|eukprot:XP_015571245.1 lysine-specific demethylase JMJ30 [Ricinus communis]
MSGAVSITDHLSTPLLDAESPNLLQSISSHGGYAYVRMATLAASGNFRAAEAAREMAWEQLHCGPWHSVSPVWRDAYSMACLHVAKFHYQNGEFKDALRVLDMGVIMGGMLLRKDLDSAIEIITSKAREENDSKSDRFDNSNSKLVQETEFDKAEVLRVLPAKSLSCNNVVKKCGLSLEAFLREHILCGSPVIISDCMAHWPARTKWNDLGYLTRVAGDRTVPVEVGKNYLCNDWKQELITFAQFLEKLQSNDSSSDVPTYLAQHPLFDQVNELRNDICIPDYCFAGGGELRSLNAWFGPAATVTPLHHDPHHNILAQVVGKKYIRLYDASLSDELHPYSETMLCNSSQVDLDNIDESKYPKVHDLEFMDCILEEGEMLYIPPKWWHYVRSLTTSLSVSFWWSESGSSAVS